MVCFIFFCFIKFSKYRNKFSMEASLFFTAKFFRHVQKLGAQLKKKKTGPQHYFLPHIKHTKFAHKKFTVTAQKSRQHWASYGFWSSHHGCRKVAQKGGGANQAQLWANHILKPPTQHFLLHLCGQTLEWTSQYTHNSTLSYTIISVIIKYCAGQ